MTFQDYLDSVLPSNTGTKRSYITAINIIDELIAINNNFNLDCSSISDIRDPYLIERITDFVAEQEDNYRANRPSIFDSGKSNQTSYPRKRFCTAAIRKLGDYINLECCREASSIMLASVHDGDALSRKLLKKFQINDRGTDKEVQTTRRIGQNIFRAMLLQLYNSACCITGIDVPDVLRASHIIPWAEKRDTRLNPQNGLCLSATYDAAFDKHLISFDEDYRMILSPQIKELYSSEAFKTHFLSFEGKHISLPAAYRPSQQYLEEHRSKLIV